MSSQYPVTMVSNPSAAPPVGFSPGNITVPFRVSGSAAVAGDVFQQDTAGVSIASETPALVPTGGAASIGEDTSVWSNMRPTAALLQSMDVPSIVGVAKRNAAQKTIVDFVLYGFVKAFCSRSASATVLIGNTLRLDDTAPRDFLATHAGDSGGATLSRQPATLQEGTTLGTTRTLLEVFVNGVVSVGASFKTT